MTDDRISVLLVEDDVHVASLVERSLEHANAAGEFVLECADTVSSGMARLQQSSINVVLLDLSLPDTHGLGTFLRIRAHIPQVPVVVLTTADDETLALQAINAGAQDYLVKSRISPELLTRSLRYCIERHRMLRELHHLVLVDELTGLSNRRGFVVLAEHQFKVADRHRSPATLVFVDLDGMSVINTRFGHREGDRALRDVAAVLATTFRESDVIGRVGRDEFSILLTDNSSDADDLVIARLQRELARHNAREGRRYELSLSLGTGRYDPRHPCSVDELIHASDLAMHSYKRAARKLAS